MSSKPFPKFLTVARAGEVLGISRNLAYQAAKTYRQTDGQEGLPNVMIGGRILVPADALRHLAKLPMPGGLS